MAKVIGQTEVKIEKKLAKSYLDALLLQLGQLTEWRLLGPVGI